MSNERLGDVYLQAIHPNNTGIISCSKLMVSLRPFLNFQSRITSMNRAFTKSDVSPPSYV